jgi:hypothetical protein
MRVLGLNFGCFDVLVTKAGEPVFLEMKANGQWQLIQTLTGLPIAQAIAEELMAACR